MQTTIDLSPIDKNKQRRPVIEPGCLVRTIRAWPGGVHRASISRVFEKDGSMFAEVAGFSYSLDELEVIRPPLD